MFAEPLTLTTKAAAFAGATTIVATVIAATTAVAILLNDFILVFLLF